MIIQSLSLDVPAPCLNSCKFCVAHMHAQKYTNQLDANKPFYNLYVEDFERRLEFARDNGCNIIMITGNGEPLLNRRYLETFSLINKRLATPFRWIELQTSGTTLDAQYLRFLRNTVWVNTISLSLSDVFDSAANAAVNQTKAGYEVDIDSLCAEIKRYDITLRLSLNMTNRYDLRKPVDIFLRAKELGADQITFRKLYSDHKDTPESRWVEENKASNEVFIELRKYILTHGNALEILPYGAIKYSVHGMGVVVDDDCMSTQLKQEYKYLILRPNCKLYSDWADEGSLIF